MTVSNSASSSLKSASAGVCGARQVITMSSALSPNVASLGVTGARTIVSVTSNVSSNVATLGVTGVNKIILLKFISLFAFTGTPSLLAKREFTWRISREAKIIVFVFILVCFFDC